MKILTMKKIMICGVTGLLAFPNMITNVLALDAPIGIVKVNVDNLRIRKEANTSSTSNGYVQEGKVYSVYAVTSDDSYTWYQIDEESWIADNGSWLTYTASGTTQTAETTDASTNSNTAYVKVSKLRIRSEASTSSSQLGYAEEGKTYSVSETVKDSNYTWYHIESGWIADRDGAWVDYSGSTDTVVENNEAEQTVTATTALNGNVTVQVSRLRIRSSYSTSSEQVGYAEESKTYTASEKIENEGYTWYHIENGWIADKNGNWVTYADATVATPETTETTVATTTPEATATPEATTETTQTTTLTAIGQITVNVSGLNIRNSYSATSARVGQATSGTTYTVYAVENNGGYSWYQIGDNQWIADNGSWCSYNGQDSSGSATVKYIGTAKVLVENLKIRTSASTSSSSNGYAEYNKTYNVISQTTNGGYSWYQIGENEWIADVSGKWVSYAGEGASTTTVSTTTAAVQGSATNPYSGGWSNCTWGAWYLVYTNLGIALPRMGNASNWLNAAKQYGYSTGSTPKVGSVVVYSYHVAYVTDVQPTTITIEEGGYLGRHNIRTVSWNSDGTQALQGYIYFD